MGNRDRNPNQAAETRRILRPCLFNAGRYRRPPARRGTRSVLRPCGVPWHDSRNNGLCCLFPLVISVVWRAQSGSPEWAPRVGALFVGLLFGVGWPRQEPGEVCKSRLFNPGLCRCSRALRGGLVGWASRNGNLTARQQPPPPQFLSPVTR